MSVEVLLVPFGIALIQAVISARKTIQERQDTVVLEPVRIVDTGLLGRALEQIGATDIVVEPDTVTARTAQGLVTFERVGQVLAGTVLDAPAEATIALAQAVDAAAGRLVQQRTAELAKERAEELGFKLIQTTNDQGTINYVFEEN